MGPCTRVAGGPRRPARSRRNRLAGNTPFTVVRVWHLAACQRRVLDRPFSTGRCARALGELDPGYLGRFHPYARTLRRPGRGPALAVGWFPAPPAAPPLYTHRRAGSCSRSPPPRPSPARSALARRLAAENERYVRLGVPLTSLIGQTQEYARAQPLNQALPASANAWLIGDAAVFYTAPQVHYTVAFNPRPLARVRRPGYPRRGRDLAAYSKHHARGILLG